MKKKYLALMWGGVFSLVASACTNEAASAKTNTKSTQPTANIKNVQVTITPKELDVGPFSKKASEITVNDVNASFTNPADNTKYKFQLLNTIPVIENNNDVSDQNGEIKVKVLITNKNNANETTERVFLVKGLRKSFGGFIDQKTQARFAPNDLITYNQLDRYQQFKLDNEKYMFQLKQGIARHILGNFDGHFELSKFRKDVTTSQKDKNYFDQKANQLQLNTYDDSLIKGFGVPTYQDQNVGDPKVSGINLYKGEISKFPSWRDIYNRPEYKANGLPRVLPNQEYKNIALQTYAFSVDNKDPDKPGDNNFKRTRGTLWILDYHKTNDGTYPTTWYFGTNLHVADAITNNTTGVAFSVLNDRVATKTIIAPANGTDTQYFDNYYIPNLKVQNGGVAEPTVRGDLSSIAGQPAGVRTVFTADDYLNKDPIDYLNQNGSAISTQAKEYDNYHEFLDFAVIEVDFAALWNNNIAATNDNLSNTNGYSNAQEYAKAFTHGYADKKEQQIKFLSKSYLSDYTRVDYPFLNKDNPEVAPDLTKYDTFFILGYPLSKFDWGFTDYEDGRWSANKDHTVSLWVNGEGRWYTNPGESITGQRAENVGDQLSTNVGYQTFPTKPGIVDSFISASRAGEHFYSNPNHRGGKKLIGFGLEYAPRHYAPYGGSSGSSVRNQKNELVGVYHVANSTAMTGLAVAFRSEGFNYHGLYGNYNLPQYDLIYGGGKDQKKSFRESLEALYGKDYHTNLFANIKQIPSDFQFKDNSQVDPLASVKLDQLQVNPS